MTDQRVGFPSFLPFPLNLLWRGQLSSSLVRWRMIPLGGGGDNPAQSLPHSMLCSRGQKQPAVDNKTDCPSAIRRDLVIV